MHLAMASLRLELHPLFELKRKLMLAQPIIAARCCDENYDEETLHTQFVENQDDLANCKWCGRQLMLVLRINWWEYPEMKVSYFTSSAVLEALCTKVFQPEELDLGFAPSPLLAAVRYHFGSLRDAYRLIGVAYPYPEIADWKNAIHPFLGTAPDHVLANLINVKPADVKKQRRQYGIMGVRGYNKWKNVDFLKIESRIRQRLRKQPKLIKAERHTIH